MRKFEIVSEFISKNVTIPVRKTKGSAGYDIELAEDLTIEPNELGYAKTGLKVKMGQDEVLFVYARSSLFKNTNNGLILPNSVGVIDSDYYNSPDSEGQIFIQLYNLSKEKVTIKKGERIAQGVFQKVLFATDEEEPSHVRVGGFGSTNN